MNKAPTVLERSVVHAGKIFIKEGEDNQRAYVIQKGKVRAFTYNGEEKVEIATFGPGTIIGEACLVIDDPIKMSFETIADTTVTTITRQDFQKKLNGVDKGIQMILTHAMKKLNEQADAAKRDAFKNADIDDEAFQLTKSILSGLDDTKRFQYEKEILPIINRLIKTLKKLKSR